MKNLKKHEFGFDLAGLSTYTDEVGGLLLAEAIVKSKTAEIGYVQSGVKGSQAINLLSSNLYVQDGSCGWTTSGDTIFTQRDITVCDYKVNEALCPRDLNDYWAGQFLNAGSYNESVPFSQQIADLKVKQIQKFVEDKLWLANTAASGGTDCFVGFYYLFGTTQNPSEQVNFVASPTTAFTSSNMLTIVDEVIAALPDAIQEKDDLVCMMSMANYRKYTVGLRQANYFHFGTETAEAATEFITFHPGTNIRVVGIPALSGKNQVVVGPASELIIGTDLMDDSERLEMFYSKDFDEVRIRCNFKAGAQIPFPLNWASNGLA
jgi:hypothetical protein